MLDDMGAGVRSIRAGCEQKSWPLFRYPSGIADFSSLPTLSKGHEEVLTTNQRHYLAKGRPYHGQVRYLAREITLMDQTAGNLNSRIRSKAMNQPGPNELINVIG